MMVVENRVDDKPNVLLLNSTLHIGGAENVIATLCRRLSRQRFNVAVGYLKQCGIVGELLQREGCEVVGVAPPTNRLLRYFSFLGLRRLIRARRIDVVHTHDLHSFIDASLCRLLMPRLRVVHTFHFGNYPHQRRRYLAIQKLLWRAPDRLIAVSHAQQKTIQQTFRIPTRRIETIWNGVDGDASGRASAPFTGYAKPGRVIIGSISTLIPQKGITDLLDVAARLKERGLDFLVLIAGEGKLRPELEAKSAALGLGEHVVFFGWVKEANKAMLPAIDIFFQPSLWEAMSMVLLEAMAESKPVVATRVGENPMIVEEGVTGLTTEVRAISDMTAALERLIRDPALRAQFGAAGRARYEKLFTAASMVHNYENLYDRLIQNGSGRGVR